MSYASHLGKGKKAVFARIYLHPVQEAIYQGLKTGKIKLPEDTLRDVATKIGVKKSPQAIKHHLGQLVSLGVIDIIGGEYKVAQQE